ncbi:MAG: IS3 family transposase, partial [Methanosarcinales archaeon]
MKRGKSCRAVKDEELLENILRIHKDNRELYGYPRVHQALIKEGVKCGRNRVARLMRENGIIAKMARRFKRHKYKHELFRSSTNLLLDREPTSAQNQVWVGDVTFIRVGNKWSYLSTVMDRH